MDRTRYKAVGVLLLSPLQIDEGSVEQAGGDGRG